MSVDRHTGRLTIFEDVCAKFTHTVANNIPMPTVI